MKKRIILLYIFDLERQSILPTYPCGIKIT